ncbi:unnamed protein product, partial [Ixodes persulcatus]
LRVRRPRSSRRYQFRRAPPLRLPRHLRGAIPAMGTSKFQSQPSRRRARHRTGRTTRTARRSGRRTTTPIWVTLGKTSSSRQTSAPKTTADCSGRASNGRRSPNPDGPGSTPPHDFRRRNTAGSHQ